MAMFHQTLEDVEVKDGPVVRFKFWAIAHRMALQGNPLMASLPSHMANRLEELRAKWELRSRVEQHAHNGWLYICVVQRDCDNVQWSERHKVAADPAAFETHLMQLYDNAEGPLWWSWLTPEEYAEFKRESRDLGMEAFENGHPHVIHG